MTACYALTERQAAIMRALSTHEMRPVLYIGRLLGLDTATHGTRTWLTFDRAERMGVVPEHLPGEYAASASVVWSMQASTNPRFCYYISAGEYVEGEGYRASVVFENVPGHSPTGNWPCGPRDRRPYFWGHTLGAAQAIAKLENDRLGLSEEDVREIIGSSMAAKECA